MNSTRRYPRSLAEAFAAERSPAVFGPYSNPARGDRLVLWACTVAAIAVAAILLME